jgi:hypothetical protein
MDILDFEYKIKTEGIKVKYKTIVHDGYDFVYKKKYKKLFMKQRDDCNDFINIFFNSYNTYDSLNNILNNISYREVFRFTKDGLFYEIESFDWIEFYDIETENLFMQYISKYYIQPTINNPFNLYIPYECLFLEDFVKHKYSKDDIIKINEKYNNEQLLLEVIDKKKNTKSVSFNV